MEIETEIKRITTEELPNIMETTETSENTEPEKEDPLKEEKEKRETLIRMR